MSGLSYLLPSPLRAAVEESLDDWQRGGKSPRLWARDASLWTSGDEARWLDWLDIVGVQQRSVPELERFAGEIRAGGFTHALLMGMGGSSLCPEVLASTFPARPGYPQLAVLDSTDPAQIRRVDAAVDADRTLYIVSSKSGGTLEPNVLKSWFFERARGRFAGVAGSRFVAITDPGSAMQRVAQDDGFRRVFFGVPGIGGRFSALSSFGMVPAAVMGLDAAQLLERAAQMVEACGAAVPAAESPGVVLGCILGRLALAGRDKVTLICSPGIASLGAWLEQLLAESTGKGGKGLIPVDGERLGPPEAYGDDRLFVYSRLATAPDSAQETAIESLERAGHPVVRIDLRDPLDLAREFFRWEIATAVAGSLLGVNPFDQPDVEASKVVTRRLTLEYEQSGALPEESPIFAEDGLRVFADQANREALEGAAGGDRALGGWLRAHCGRLRSGDYFALLAWLDRAPKNDASLQAIRNAVGQARRVATCLGYGPRFLHSTGQAYKGGPNSGVFLQVTCEEAADLAVPGYGFTFGVVKAAQARGDFEVLAGRGRRVLRVDLGADVARGLEKLRRAMGEALR